MFWNLGILVLADTILPFIDEIGRSCNWSVESELQSCRQIAVSSIAQVIESVSALPNEANFNILNGLSPEVPIIGYHVTPSLMTSALAKAVEHSILLRVSNIDTLDNVVGHEPTGCDDPGARIIDTLVKGLLSLDVTIGGSHTVGVAFQSLMRRYGDIISEYWY
ncbi:hypothetical protein N7466_002244 [Penicillium verhagenii]|uniref:uncharacterized protein n=1 Tax=Penicillium verhagenii TaxID=1562060 RepID=UPI0025452DB2|nr:uncharacterized protein N7466_002244 [Penicillium verhagenii]KAJ5939110.1 hypothetical protein N7466_002244 [Penicillium verhagenii]